MSAVRTGDAVPRVQAKAPARHVLAVAWRRKTPYLFLGPALLVLATIILYPMLFNFQISLYDVRRVDQPLEEFIGVENYRRVWDDDDFWNSLKVSFRFTVISVVIGAGHE
jgi:ABC-type sugar transport system permease subunit